MANIWGTIGKKSIKAIGGMTKAEIEAAKEAERRAAQASWDAVASIPAAREKTGLRYSPAIGPELAGRQYAKDTAKFPGMAEYEPRISDTDWLKSWNKDEPLYHGMSAPMSGDFLYPTRHPSFPEPRGISLSPSRDTAAQYGDNIIETYGRGQYGEGQAFMARARELMASGKSSAEASAIAQKELQDQGFTGVRMSPREVSIFDPKDLRRTDAAFDPAKKDSKDLLAQAMLGAGIGAGGYALGAPQDADAMPDAYALKEALTLTLGAGVAGGVYANAPTRRYLKNTPARIRYGMESKMDNAESVTRTIDLPNGAEINFNVGRGAGGLLPKDVTWDIGLPMDSKAEEALKNAYINRYNTAIQYGAEGPEYAKAEAEWDAARSDVKSAMSGAGRKAAVPAFRAAKQALLDDMATRSPFAPWSPESGYSFYGATGKHDKIYESMIRNTKHPDYFPQIKDDRFYLRRKFPYRHEVAAGVGAGALLAPSSAEGGNIPDGAGDFAGDFQPHFIVNPRQEHAAAAPTRSDELNDLIGPAFDKLAGGDYLGAGFALGQGVPEYLKRRQGDPQAVAADAFELWDPTGLASIPLQWWDQNKYNEDVVRRPDFSSDGGGPEVARYKKRAIFAKGRK